MTLSDETLLAMIEQYGAKWYPELNAALEELRARRSPEWEGSAEARRIRKMVRDVTGIHATFAEDAVRLGLAALVRDAKSKWGSVVPNLGADVPGGGTPEKKKALNRS